MSDNGCDKHDDLKSDISEIKTNIALIKNRLEIGVVTKDILDEKLEKVYKRINGLVMMLIGSIALMGSVIGYLLEHLNGR